MKIIFSYHRQFNRVSHCCCHRSMNFIISLLFCVHHFLCYVHILLCERRAFCFNCSTNYYVFNVDILSWFHIHFMSALVCYYLNIFITHSFLSDFFLFFIFHSLPLSCVLLFHLAFTLLLKEEERWEIRQRHARVYTYSNIFCNDVLFIIVRMIRSKKMREVSQ